RSTVIVYNPELISEADLPDSLLDLAEPEWKGRWGAAPAKADFQAIVSAVLETQGEDGARAWLEGMANNATEYRNNIVTMKAVNAGEVPVGVIYHYYWYRDQDAAAEDSAKTKLHYLGNQDPGAFVSVSGGGVLKNAPHADEAQQFLAFITGEQGQKILGEGYSFEYPVASDVPAKAELPPLDGLDAPAIDPSTLNGPKVIELMTEAGLL
ncbi:MAG: extracellular solute-binding protein, partial [Microterricola sp.]